jgi:hypothetical protein
MISSNSGRYVKLTFIMKLKYFNLTLMLPGLFKQSCVMQRRVRNDWLAGWLAVNGELEVSRGRCRGLF